MPPADERAIRGPFLPAASVRVRLRVIYLELARWRIVVRTCERGGDPRRCHSVLGRKKAFPCFGLKVRRVQFFPYKYSSLVYTTVHCCLIHFVVVCTLPRPWKKGGGEKRREGKQGLGSSGGNWISDIAGILNPRPSFSLLSRLERKNKKTGCLSTQLEERERRPREGGRERRKEVAAAAAAVMHF